MTFVDEEEAKIELCDVVINVTFDDFIDFLAELISDFSLSDLVELVQNGNKILATLWLSVCNVQIMKSDLLDDFLLFVDLTLRDRDELIIFQLSICDVLVCPTKSFHNTRVCLDVDNVSLADILLFELLVDGAV